MSKTELEDIEQPRSKGIYLLPNLFTTVALFAGFYAIVAAMKGLFDYAPIAIFIAMIADSLDGRVARLTNTQSDFGAQYDSLSDMIASGLAPALFAYSFLLQHLGKIGWLAAFVYVAATGLRLARFNIQEPDKRYFFGLPCPAAAGCITSMLWLENIYQCQNVMFVIATAVVIVLLAVLQVSNIRFRSFKDSDFKNRVSFMTILIIILLFVAVAIDPPTVLFVIFFAYALSGPLTAVRHLKRK